MQDGSRHALIAGAIGLLCFSVAAAVLKSRPPEPVEVHLAPPAPNEGVLAGASVSLRLLSATGAPMTCKATLWEVVEGGRRMGMDASKSCGPGGSLLWQGLRPGKYVLMVAGTGSERLDLPLDIQQDQAVDLGERRVGPGGNVTGKVLDAEGQPVPLTELRTGDREERANPDGVYMARGLKPGLHSLRFGSLKGTATVEVTVVAGETLTQDVSLVPHDGVIGVRFDDDGVITDVHVRGPAHGLLTVGQRVLTVDGQPVDDREALSEALRGPVGGSLTLGLEGGEVELVRTSLEEMLQ